MPDNILGSDILQGQTLQISVNDICLQVRVIKPELRGSASQEQVSLLPVPVKGGNVRQYKLPGMGVHKEIGETIQELL